MKPVLILAIILLILSPAFNALAIYKYVDDKGHTIFVDDESKIPPRYLEKSKSLGLPELSSEEKAEQSERLRKAREERQDKLKKARKERAKQELMKQMETPIVVRGHQVLVPVEVSYGRNKIEVMMLLDTGATVTIFHRQALAELNIPDDEGRLAYGTGVGGVRVATRRVKFSHIKVGPFKAERTSAYIINNRGSSPGYSGLLGMDFLRYIPYEVDFRREVIRWKK